MQSPDGSLLAEFLLQAGRPLYTVGRNGTVVLRESRLGLIRDDEDFSKDLALLGQTGPEPVEDRYEILTAKRRVNIYRANRYVFHLRNRAGGKMDVIFQLSNDGIAFRYLFPDHDADAHTIIEEVTSFRLPSTAAAWLQPMSVAKTGFEGTNPAYEEHYAKDIPVGTPSTLGAGWVFPALFRLPPRGRPVALGDREGVRQSSDDIWLLISEAALGRNYCGCRLRHDSPDGEYSIGFPDPSETMANAPVNPQPTLPWLTPWRLIIVGSLKAIAESTLGIDLADKPAEPPDPSIKPGKASWSWPLLGDANTTFDVQKQFIDYAAHMNWAYCLIDSMWDKQIGDDGIRELVRYAASKNVGILLWYNSAGDWNTAPQTPRDRMLTRESRLAEFEKLKAMGVRGLKIDFFGGDGQAVIHYYLDILEDAAPYGFLMNFHGSTLPRGWHRTYPHLMTMEGVRGFEFVTFEQRNADEQPSHCAMLPFTRNVFDPMDFTPLCLDRISDRVTRRTTAAFELALSILFTSGIQHYAEIRSGMAKMPEYVQDFLRRVPSVWDDIRFLDGFPGKFVVLARRSDKRWYLAGINGEASQKTWELDLSPFQFSGNAELITDGRDGNVFEKRSVDPAVTTKLQITLKPHGGFVMTMGDAR